jgi:hypothetical protein
MGTVRMELLTPTGSIRAGGIIVQRLFKMYGREVLGQSPFRRVSMQSVSPFLLPAHPASDVASPHAPMASCVAD